jgi:hypothetical protein
LARYIWAKELLEFESVVFTSFGVNSNVKYIFTVPIFLFVLYSYYKQDAQRLAGTGRPVISKGVVIFAGVSLAFVVSYFYFFIGGDHA